MDGNRWSVDRAAWVLFGVVLVGLVAEFLTPRSVQLTGFLLIPVLASVAYGRPALSAVLAVVASASAVSIQLWLGYDHRTVLVRSVLIAASGGIAVWLAASRARITRERAASEERYRLLAENAGDLVAHVRDGRFVWVSPSVEQVLGEPASHWVGRQFRAVVHSDDQRAIAAGMATLERGESTVKERIQVVSPAGVKHWVDLRAAPFRDDNGESDGITMAMRVVDDEVAAQREVDQARREQERADALYRRSMNSASVGMCLADLEGKFIQVNPAICEFFGYDAESLQQMTWLELTAADYLDADLEARAEVIEGRSESYRMVKEFIHSSGRPIWGDLAVSCLRSPNGRVEVFIGQISDITAQVEAEERNRQLTRKLQEQNDLTKAELDSAAHYMASIMPRELQGPVAVSSRFMPSREVGGDCLDYYWVDDDHLIVYLLDVSGHGIEPALLAASLQNLLRAETLPVSTLTNPEATLSELNRLFQMDQQAGHYFTIWYGVYQPSTRTLRYARAGHPPAIVLLPDGSDPVLLESGSVPIGVLNDSTYDTYEYQLDPGAVVLIYSDGAYELALADGGHGALEDFLHLFARTARSPQWTLDGLVDQLKSRSEAGRFDDDCSLVLLTFD